MHRRQFLSWEPGLSCLPPSCHCSWLLWARAASEAQESRAQCSTTPGTVGGSPGGERGLSVPLWKGVTSPSLRGTGSGRPPAPRTLLTLP